MNRKVRSIFKKLILIMAMVIAWGPDCLAARPKKADVWQIRENLVLRFGAEWYKIGVLSRELSAVGDVLAEIRDLESFPYELTGFNETTQNQLGKQAVKVEKKIVLLKEQIEAFRSPLSDAMAILREMVIGEPVESMFETLERGDLKRINQMLSIKHQIDSLWQENDSLLNFVMVNLGITIKAEKSDGPFEEEFFKIIKANLGIQSQQYYDKLNHIKNLLVNRGKAAHVVQVFNIEKQRIEQYLLNNEVKLAHKKILILLKRFESKMSDSELYMQLARVQFLEKQYGDVLATLIKIPDNDTTIQFKTLYRLQSLYALRDYEAIWNERASLNISKTFTGSKKNLLIWILLESGLALHKQENFLNLASMVDKNASYAIHVMHALGRSYLQSNDNATALSVMESALKFKLFSADDNLAFREVHLAVAEMFYEVGNYKKALSLFYAILNEKKDFDRALFGIIWCYIQLGQDDKAETALRKLINQAPESPLGAEGILILAKRHLFKAGFDWKKAVFLQKEEQRLQKMLERVSDKESKETSRTKASKYAYARRELTSLLSRLKQEEWPDYNSIIESYKTIDRVCGLISKHYKTGSFQESSFSPKREKMLHFLDSIMMEAKGNNLIENARMVSNARQNRIKIKKTVDRANVFSAVVSIDKFRWEREYIEWEKTQLNHKKKSLLQKISTTKDSVEIKKLGKSVDHCESRMDSLLVREENISNAHFKKLTAELPVLISSDLDNSDAAYLRYQLGELYYAAENKSYSGLYEEYEKKLAAYYQDLTAYRDGELVDHPQLPTPPKLDHTKSIKQFRTVLSHYPQSEFVPPTLYSIAWCFNDISMLDSALFYMEKLAVQYPECSHTPQAWMYTGEYNFERGNLDKSIKCYQAAMGYPESEWFDEALYKLAWTQYRMSNPEKAISSFLALVGLGKDEAFKKPLLEKESMDYIAISFSETDPTGDKGLVRATAFAKKLGDLERGCQILHRLAIVYKDQGRTDMAKKAYRTLLKTYPQYSRNPFAEAELVTILEKEISIEESNRIKIRLYKDYNQKSAWASTQSGAIIAQADSIAEKSLYEGAIGYHQLALQKNDTNAYDLALDTYREFITAYPASSQANECHYNLAEIQFSLGNYMDAAQEYMAVSKRYPDSQYKETAAWNAIVASQNLLKQENGVDE